jgi:hypothetical protein
MHSLIIMHSGQWEQCDLGCVESKYTMQIAALAQHACGTLNFYGILSQTQNNGLLYLTLETRSQNIVYSYLQPSEKLHQHNKQSFTQYCRIYCFNFRCLSLSAAVKPPCCVFIYIHCFAFSMLGVLWVISITRECLVQNKFLKMLDYRSFSKFKL